MPARSRRLLGWLLLAGVIALGSGYGVHEPWAPDSPRFAAVARDMLATGDWLFPRVGGDLYPDKPPVFFWLMAGSIWLTGSVRAGFLLPSLLAGLGTLWLVFDLSRRLWGTRAAMLAGLLLLSCVQFVLQAHTAQIDGTLAFLTTLGLYGLLRHLLLGPDWGWYAAGGAACGLGVITKGVGFLPLLVLLPWGLLRWRGAVPGPRGGALNWSLAPLAALAMIAIWFVPMIVASLGDPALAAYRDEILFGQTVDRYVAAEGHREPFWYFFTGVIPWAWLPLVLALPWLVPRWRAAWRERDARVLLPLGWALLVLGFFMLSSGKRGVYILPALPAMCLAAAPYLEDLLRRRRLNRAASGLLVVFALAAAFAFGELAGLKPDEIGVSDPAVVPHLAAVAAIIALLALVFLGLGPRRDQGFARLAGFLMSVWLVLGWYLMPVIDDERSGVCILEAAYAALPPDADLGITRPKESLILQATGPFTNFGHRRPDPDQEMRDAAAWLAAAADRYLILPDEVVAPCFDAERLTRLGHAHRRDWLLAGPGTMDEACVAEGDATRAIPYRAPASLPSLWR
ncbi:ArnT family glycosyltransferase [Lentisalinibacter salinarum]|uniref:ArnT family glycosyltransferase n=1 Tax=Lentisalinibacter salinarum TaxID=2992239 RepID=UPI00386A76E8